MKTQTLYKRLSLPLLLTVISATGIGISSPARSASLIGSQDTVIARKPPCDPPSIVPPHCDGAVQWRAPVDVDHQQQQQQQRKLQQQREIQQQREQQQREQQQREIQQQQPTAEPSP